VAYSAEDYHKQEYTELDRRMAKKKQSQQRQADELLASTGGGLFGGQRGQMHRQVQQDVDEQWRATAQAIEARRFAAEEADRQRGWQTGERTGSEQHQTGMQQGLFGQQTALQEGQFGQQTAMSQLGHQQTLGQMGAGFGYQQQLQGQAEQAKMELQRLVDSGQMTQLEAQQAYQAWESTGQWGHEAGMQGAQLGYNQWQQTGQWSADAGLAEMDIAQQQWSAMFGQAGAMQLQNSTQAFEQFMASQGRDWELADRDWHNQMWLMDAQLQMAISGYDWDADGPGGGPPYWMFAGGSYEGGGEYDPFSEDWNYYRQSGGSGGGSGGGCGVAGSGYTQDQLNALWQQYQNGELTQEQIDELRAQYWG
jgi:hypothetical protein